jgi:hypothetical protein
MLEKAYTALSKNMVRIDPNRFNKLVTALSTATSSPNNLEYGEKTGRSVVLEAFLQLSILLQPKQ